jgi:hypothetical protein
VVTASTVPAPSALVHDSTGSAIAVSGSADTGSLDGRSLIPSASGFAFRDQRILRTHLE